MDEEDDENEGFMAGGYGCREGRERCKDFYMYVQSFVGKKRGTTDRLARDAGAAEGCMWDGLPVPWKGAFSST